jgi:hypothetical protein
MKYLYIKFFYLKPIKNESIYNIYSDLDKIALIILLFILITKYISYLFE